MPTGTILTSLSSIDAIAMDFTVQTHLKTLFISVSYFCTGSKTI
jgi:hypothetical protein